VRLERRGGDGASECTARARLERLGGDGAVGMSDL